MTDDPRLGLPSASSFAADVLCPGRRNLIGAGCPEEALWRCLGFDKAPLLELIQAMMNCRESEAEVWYENQLDAFIGRGRGEPILAEA